VENPEQLNDFLENLLDLVAILSFSLPAQDLADFGLNPALATIELIASDAAPVLLFIGSPNSEATGTYVRIGRGGAVILTGAPLMPHFEQALRAITSIGFPRGKDISARTTPVQIPDRSDP